MYRYRINATISDSTGSMSTVIFDGAGRHLLSMTCEELAAIEDPMKKLYSVMKKKAFMIIQLLYDKKTRTLEFVVNKAAQCANFVKNVVNGCMGASFVKNVVNGCMLYTDNSNTYA
ncbi:putative nucleic acid-binding protein [Helianthus anomalus]